jgi:hypothetical protein
MSPQLAFSASTAILTMAAFALLASLGGLAPGGFEGAAGSAPFADLAAMR